MMNMLDLMDKEVIGLNGWLIGTVRNVAFDENTWQINLSMFNLMGTWQKNSR